MEYSKKQAEIIAAFYAGGTDPDLADAEKPAHVVRAGLYPPEEAAASAAAAAQTVQPGSWQDMEARGIPFQSWPDAVKDRFMADQESGVYVAPALPHTEPPQALPGQPAVQPGSWQDFEARNIPYESWPGYVQERFLYEQENPQAVAAPAAPVTTPQPIAQAAGEPNSVNYADVINSLSMSIHEANIAAGWWTDLTTGQTLLGKDEHGRDRRNVGELLCLVHSEVSEAMEGYRKNLMDDKLPHRSMLEVELADVFIRIFDIAGAHSLDLGGAIAEKRSFNANRADHKVEHRLSEGGKRF